MSLDLGSYPNSFSMALCFSTFGDVKILVEYLRIFNHISFQENESIKSFNLRLKKLYDQILNVVLPFEQAALVKYYQCIPLPYQDRLK